MSDDEQQNNDGGGIPEGVDFQKYAEDMLMQRLLAKEKKEKDEQQRRRATTATTTTSSMSGLTETELLWVAGVLLAIIFSCIGVALYLYLTKRK